jgi:hypothetical protein
MDLLSWMWRFFGHRHLARGNSIATQQSVAQKPDILFARDGPAEVFN